MIYQLILMVIHNYRQYTVIKNQGEEIERKTYLIDSLESVITMNQAIVINAKLEAELAVAEAEKKFYSLERAKIKRK